LLRDAAAAARERGLPLQIHAAQSVVEFHEIMRRHGKTPIEFLRAAEVLGPNAILGHAIFLDHHSWLHWPTRKDLARLAETGTTVAHCPTVFSRRGITLEDVGAYRRAGVNLGIGTDGSSCADNQNMYEALRLASFVSKVQGPEWQRWLTTREAALAATEGSARALGFGDRIGRIAPGWKADLVLLDLDHPNWMPLNDPVNQLVHCEDGTAVDSVMIGGRLVVEGRKPVGVDLGKLRERAEAARERLTAANADNHRLYQALEPVRTALLRKMRAQIDTPGMGPEALRSLLAQMNPSELGFQTGDAVLDRFQLKLLTEGSGTQIFSTTFAQWTAREALRRAQPCTLLVRFAPRQRQKPMNELLTDKQQQAESDPAGSLLDADFGAYYNWMNQQRLSGAEQSSFLVWFENHSIAVAIGPLMPRGTESTQSVDLKTLLSWMV